MTAGLSILQATPRPGRCGITDSSLALQAALREQGADSEILCLTDVAEIPPEFRRIGSADALADMRGVMVVQLSPYGFQSRGVPYALMRGLRRFAAREGNSVISYFHETWARSSSPFKSAFWLTGIQRLVCHRILETSAFAFFSSPATWAWGACAAGKDRVAFCPTFSNVGEPDRIEPWTDRPGVMAVFGSTRTRPHCYLRRRALEEFIECHRISEILDIGPPMESTVQARLKGLPIRFQGSLSASAVSARLQSARFGIFTSPWGVASKSGVFAAYQAHGVVPVSTHDLPDANYQGEPGPVLNRDFIRLGDAEPLPDWQLAELSGAIHSRYSDRGVGAVAALIQELARRGSRPAA